MWSLAADHVVTNHVAHNCMWSLAADHFVTNHVAHNCMWSLAADHVVTNHVTTTASGPLLQTTLSQTMLPQLHVVPCCRPRCRKPCYHNCMWFLKSKKFLNYTKCTIVRMMVTRLTGNWPSALIAKFWSISLDLANSLDSGQGLNGYMTICLDCEGLTNEVKKPSTFPYMKMI